MEPLFPSGTWIGEARAICRRASDEQLLKACWVNFVGGNAMVVPIEELLGRLRKRHWGQQEARLEFMSRQDDRINARIDQIVAWIRTGELPDQEDDPGRT